MRKIGRLFCGRLLPCALTLLILLAAGIFLAIYLPQALAPIAALERLLSLGAALFLMVSSLPAERKTVRLALLLLPWLGFFLCLFLPRGEEPNPASAGSPSFDDGTANALSALAERGCALRGCRAESARYFRTGREMAEALLGDLRAARREILLDFYLLAPGAFLGDVLSALTERARAGVSVRLIYDDFGSLALPKGFQRELGRRGILSEVFHPVGALPLGSLNRRDHRKIAVIDREIAYTGGVNLADEYIGKLIRFGHWKDSALRLTGEPALRFAALYFHEASDRPPTGTGSPCVVFGDAAGPGERVGEEIFFHLIASAKARLYLTTPYLAPSEKLLFALLSAARSGVDVRILIPHIPDKKAVFALSRRYARELGRRGVRTREYTPGFVHAKILVADGKYAVVGSYNLDRRSLLLQSECGAFVQDEALAGEVERDFLSCWETGEPPPKARFGERIAAAAVKLFEPLL